MSLACRVCGKGPFKNGRAVAGHENWCVKRTPEFATKRMLSMRADLIRVARLVGAPEGYAPPMLAYEQHGRYSEKLIAGWFSGYTPAGNPRGSWRSAVGKLGLKVFGDHYHASVARVSADIRRVALELGRPFHIPPRQRYAELGRWDPETVYHHMGVTNWGAVADRLMLKQNTPFGHRKVTDEQATEIRARYATRTRGDVEKMAREYGITRTQIRRIATTPEQQGSRTGRAA